MENGRVRNSNSAWARELPCRILCLFFTCRPLMGTICRSGCEFCLAAGSWSAWLGCGRAVQPCCQPDLGRAARLQPGSICESRLWEPSLCPQMLTLLIPTFLKFNRWGPAILFSWKWHRISFSLLVYFLCFLPGTEIQKTFSRAKAIPVVWHLNLFQSKKGLPSPLGLLRLLQDLSIESERNIVRIVNLSRFLQMQLALFFWCEYGFYYATFSLLINVRDFQYALNFVVHWYICQAPWGTKETFPSFVIALFLLCHIL